MGLGFFSPVAEDVVAHDCEEGGGVAAVQRRQLEPGPGGRVRGGHCQVVQHVVKQLPGAINLGEQLEDIGTKLISLQSIVILDAAYCVY